MALSNKITNLMKELQGACHYDGTQLFCCAIDKRDGAEVDVTAADTDALKVMLMVLVKTISDETGETPRQVVKHTMKAAKKCGLFKTKQEEEEEEEDE